MLRLLNCLNLKYPISYYICLKDDEKSKQFQIAQEWIHSWEIRINISLVQAAFIRCGTYRPVYLRYLTIRYKSQIFENVAGSQFMLKGAHSEKITTIIRCISF